MNADQLAAKLTEWQQVATKVLYTRDGSRERNDAMLQLLRLVKQAQEGQP